jgi:GTP-binding protein
MTTSPPRAGAAAGRPRRPRPPRPTVVAAGWLHTARFLTSAPELHFLPALEVPEIAFVGRSNAGKSTCINTLTQQKQLAFASRKPGRTQHINLFALGKQGATDAVFADLPGYGYAAVPRQDKIRWQQVMANYLVTRANLQRVVLLCDPRLGLTELDEILLDVIRPRVEQGLQVPARADEGRQTHTAPRALPHCRSPSCRPAADDAMLFSATKRQGFDDGGPAPVAVGHPAGLRRQRFCPGAPGACGWHRPTVNADCCRPPRDRVVVASAASIHRRLAGGRTLKRLCTQ